MLTRGGIGRIIRITYVSLDKCFLGKSLANVASRYTIYSMLCNYRRVKFNPLKLCNMDIQRLYHLAYQEPKESSSGEILNPGFHYLIMDSIIQGQYGVVNCRCIAQIETPFDFKSYFVETSGEPEGSLFVFRQNCISFFNSNILPLFNPLIRIQDEVPFASPSES